MAIQKLEIPKTIRWDDEGLVSRHIIIKNAYNKINELVDAVNTIQKEREAERFEIQEWIGILEAVRKSVNVHEKQIDELQMKSEPEKLEIDDTDEDDIAEVKLVLRNMVKADGKFIFDALTKNENLYTKSMRMDKELAEEEVERLQKELARTRKALDMAVDVLKEIDELLSSNKFDVREVPLLNITQTKISMLLKCINIEQKESAFVHNKIEFPEFNDNLLEEFDKQFFENGQDDDLIETALEQKDTK